MCVSGACRRSARVTYFVTRRLLSVCRHSGDLWGPLLVCMMLSIQLSIAAPEDQRALVFAAVFVLVAVPRAAGRLLRIMSRRTSRRAEAC